MSKPILKLVYDEITNAMLTEYNGMTPPLKKKLERITVLIEGAMAVETLPSQNSSKLASGNDVKTND